MAGRSGISDEERLERLKQIKWDQYREEMDIWNLLDIFSYKTKESIVQMIEAGQLKAYSSIQGKLVKREPGETRKALRLVFLKEDVQETVQKFISGEYVRKRGTPAKDISGDAYRKNMRHYYETVIKPKREAEKLAKQQGEQASSPQDDEQATDERHKAGRQ